MLYAIISHLSTNKILSKALLFFIFFLAIFSFFHLKRLSYPNVSLNTVEIMTVYPGSSARDVEVNVTRPIEDGLKNLTGIKEYSSISIDDLSKVTVTLDIDGVDHKETINNIRSEIDKISDFPNDLPNRPEIQEVNVDIIPIYDVALVLKDQSETDWERIIRPHIKALEKKFKKIDEISHISLNGFREREIQILLNEKLMNKFNISFNDINSVIKNTKLRATGGSIESYRSQKHLITISDFQTVEELSNIIVRSNYSGKQILLKDVASVSDSFEKRDMIVRYNGNKGISIYIFKKANADIIRTIDKIKKVQSEFQDNAPEGIDFISTLDLSIETKSRLKMVTHNLLLGLSLVFFILMIFLNRKIAFWTALGIPISVAILFIFMPLFNVTINSISLCGIIVVLGMIVDDAIVISEMIYKNLTSGLPPLDAATKAVRGVFRPVLSTILTTIVAFIPIYYLPGMIGKFAQEVPTIIIIILIGSFLEATLLLPAHIIKSYSNKSSDQTALGEKLLIYLEELYISFLNVVISKKYLSALVIVTIVATGIYFTAKISKFKMFPEDQANTMYLTVETKLGSSLNRTSEVATKVESIIETVDKNSLDSYRTFIGRKFEGYLSCDNCFFIKVALTPFTSREESIIDIKDQIERSIEQQKIDEIKRINIHISSGGPPLGKPIEILVKNNNDSERSKTVQIVKDALKNYPLKNVVVKDQELSEELHLYPIHNEISRSKLTVSQIAYTIRTAFEGDVVGEVINNNESIPIRMMLDKLHTNGANPLKDLLALNTTGQLLSVDKFVKMKPKLANKIIFHHDSERANTLTADISDSNFSSNQLYKKIHDHFEKMDLNGSELSFKGEGKESFNILQKLFFALMAAVLFIYIILSLQFQSFSIPFLILFVQPFAPIGIGLMFYLHNMELSYFALVGILGCTGVIVNDSLIMIDFINKLYKFRKNENRIELIKLGAKARLRPILLTTITTLAGLLPSAYAILGDVDIFVSPMVMAMGWGLFFGTISVLIIIPLSFSIYEELSNLLIKSKNVA